MPEEQKTGILRNFFAAMLARGVVGFLCFFAFIMGGFIAGAGLHDPDTCWLLAVGKLICDGGAVPRHDIWSYTMPALDRMGAVDFEILHQIGTSFSMEGNQSTAGTDARGFVAYQWFSEVLFYLAYLLGGGYGLVALSASVLVSALIALPVLFFRKVGSLSLSSVMLVILAVVSASFHFLVRPEIFSYLFLSLLLLLILDIRKEYPLKSKKDEVSAPETDLSEERLEASVSSSASNWRGPVAIFVLLLVWSNMHTGFVLGLICLLVFALSASIEAAMRRERRSEKMIRAWLALGAAAFATMINPYGLELWHYLPQLFFTPINEFIVELRPIGISDLKEWTFYPFFLLSLWSFLLLLRELKNGWQSEKRFPVALVFSLIMIISCIAGGLYSRRIIPFSTLFLTMEIGWLSVWGKCLFYRDNDLPIENSAKGGFLSLANEKIRHIFSEGAWSVIFVVFGLLGVVLITTRVSRPVIPQESVAFMPPFRALEHIASKPPPGRCLNHPQFGDLMIWYLSTEAKPLLFDDPDRLIVAERALVPRVFIDTRFDMYGPHLVSDYHRMVNCKPGWEDTLARYRFDWAFLPVKARLTARLLSDSEHWTLLYRDERAVILAKRESSENSASESLN